jgi:glycine/sarcosine/betaine reductase component B subunit
VIHTVRACERRGIKTVFLTSEDNPAGGAPTMLEPVPEADAIVSTGFFHTKVLGLGPFPPVARVIGNPEKARAPMRDTTVAEATVTATSSALPPPGRYDDHYGFNDLTSFLH